MPEYLAPGVYVEEVSTGPKPIEGVSTSTAGFVGPTERGPESTELITSWLEFGRWYGGHVSTDTTFMTQAVQGFFDNGGKRCFVARVANKDAKPALKAAGSLTIVATGRGAWGNRVFVVVKPATKAKQGIERAKDWVRVSVLYFAKTIPATVYDPTNPDNITKPDFVPPDVFEDFDNVTHVEGAANNVRVTINMGSQLIQAVWGSGGAAKPDLIEQPAPLIDGNDGSPLTIDDYVGIADFVDIRFKKELGRDTGLAGLERVDAVSILVAPDDVTVGGLADKVIDQCDKLKDRFAIVNAARKLTATARPLRDTTYGAVYYPWVKVYDSLTRDDVPVPPAGHVAGVYARTDIEVGVHKAPANAVVVGAKDLDIPITKGDQDLYNPAGINCLRDFRPDGRGIRVWGARTMSSDPEMRYVNIRRLFLFIEESIQKGTQWVVFEPNNQPTWDRVVRTITAFLTTVWRSGALFGTNQDQAFFVRCDQTTMTEDDIDNGRLICKIGIAPVKPAEFVIIRIGQKTADATS